MSDLASPIGVLLILILIAVCVALFMLLTKHSDLVRQIADLETYLHNLEKQADHNSGVLFRVADAADQLRLATDENTTTIEAMRRDIGHLSDDVRGEVGTSRAIEMARAGASKDDIAAKTGIAIEEAEALVTFHGKSSKK
ncbi:DUF2802 domain-containing protein [Alphaproteobacteria bacterium]|jgi:hypothetical protein|nr:DUF2802 domain-containing protein [Alphaproteobacteria bacterium]